MPGVRNSQGPVIAALDAPALQALARAGGGAYSGLTTGDADLNRVLRDPSLTTRALAPDDPMLADSWKELGPWIVLALLPLGALAFRRGWVLGIALLVANLTLSAPQPAMAFGWDDLWQRRDQQAANALADADYERARELAQDPLRSGTASYRLGDYDAAVDAFAAGDGSEHHYNRGNALAAAGRLEDAIAAYEEALARAPDMADALHNKQQIEQLLEQQQQQEQQQSDSGEQSGEQGDQSDQEQQSGSDQSPDQETGDQEPANKSPVSRGLMTKSPANRLLVTTGLVKIRTGNSKTRPRGKAATSPASRNSKPARATTSSRPTPTALSPRLASKALTQRTLTMIPRARTARRRTRPSATVPSRPPTIIAPRPLPKPATPPNNRHEEGAAAAAAAGDEELTPEELESRQAADQWLRRVPDDPAGLLRRKFLYQYRARAEQGGEVEAGNPW